MVVHPPKVQRERESLRAQLRQTGRTLVIAYAVAVALVVVLVAASAIVDRPFGFFSRDPAEVADEPVYVGVLSQVSVLVWWSGAAVAIFAALAIGSSDGAARAALLAGGSLTALLALDDVFMVHERVAPDWLGVPDLAVEAGYVLLVIGWVVRFRAFLRTTEWVLLALAVPFFTCAITVDAFLAEPRHIIEDGSKLLGIVSWTLYLVRTSVRVVRRSGP